MSLKPLQPQSPARIEWEGLVCYHLSVLGDCSNGDAQGLMEANSELVDDCFGRDIPMEPIRAAKRILGPAPTEPDTTHRNLREKVGIWHGTYINAYRTDLVALLADCDALAQANANLSAETVKARELAQSLNTAIGSKDAELVEAVKRNIAYRLALSRLLPFAQSHAEDKHTAACETDGEAGRDLLTEWRMAFDAIEAATKLLREPAPRDETSDALRVPLCTPAIRDYLRAHDTQALKQALRAIGSAS